MNLKTKLIKDNITTGIGTVPRDNVADGGRRGGQRDRLRRLRADAAALRRAPTLGTPPERTLPGGRLGRTGAGAGLQPHRARQDAPPAAELLGAAVLRACAVPPRDPAQRRLGRDAASRIIRANDDSFIVTIDTD